MAILLVNIDNPATMALNEFYDYNGHCYALSCSRDREDGVAITFNDFYESTVATSQMSKIPVVFCRKEDEKLYIVGWYKSAEIHSKRRFVSLFLEGNIVANASDVVLLKQKKIIESVTANFMFRNYCVIEMEDGRYDKLAELIYVDADEKNKYTNVFTRYPYVHIELDGRAKKSYDVAIRYCESLAGNIMNDNCQGIAEIKALKLYAEEAVRLDKSKADGYYYLALANYQLGFVKDGMKAVERALTIEPEASDINALKANLLVSMGYFDTALELYQKAAQLDDDESELYLEYAQRVLQIKRQSQW